MPGLILRMQSGLLRVKTMHISNALTCKKSRKRIDSPEFMDDYYKIQQAQLKTARAIISEGKTPDKVLGVGKNAISFSGYLIEPAVSRDKRIACKKGCSVCCCVSVDVTMPEVFIIAELIKTWDNDKRSALNSRIESYQDNFSGELELRIPCPLLEKNACLVYDCRPIKCRGCNSYNPGLCKKSDTQMKTNGSILMFSNAIMNGLSLALTGFHGIESESKSVNQIFKLAGILKKALEPNAIERWIKNDL